MGRGGEGATNQAQDIEIAGSTVQPFIGAGRWAVDEMGEGAEASG